MSEVTLRYQKGLLDYTVEEALETLSVEKGAGRIAEAVADYKETFNHGIQQAIQESFRLKDQYGLE
jgi:hypothetical protein